MNKIKDFKKKLNFSVKIIAAVLQLVKTRRLPKGDQTSLKRSNSAVDLLLRMHKYFYIGTLISIL